MKKKLSVLIIICFWLLLICGCTNEIPEFLPGEHGGDLNFVWVCKKPFGFFALTDDHAKQYYGHLKGYIECEEGFVCFYTAFDAIDGATDFRESKIWGDSSEYDSFWGYADYNENYFDLEIERDRINFFGGELPTLRFEKMTKEAFLEEFGEIENVSELLE